jgi:hypothetical protein
MSLDPAPKRSRENHTKRANSHAREALPLPLPLISTIAKTGWAAALVTGTSRRLSTLVKQLQLGGLGHICLHHALKSLPVCAHFSRHSSTCGRCVLYDSKRSHFPDEEPARMGQHLNRACKWEVAVNISIVHYTTGM